MPDHFPMPINKDGEGPAEPDETVGWECWCNKPGCLEYTQYMPAPDPKQVS